MRFAGMVLLLAALVQLPGVARGDLPPSPFTHRGYYFTLTRMPTFGLDAWKQIVDCVRADGGNLVILWTAGGFRSKKFPDTWAHNTDHENVKKDFVRELIDYAHAQEGQGPARVHPVRVRRGEPDVADPPGVGGRPARTASRPSRSASTAGAATCARPGPTSGGSCSTT